jgi:hypothetical protein
MQIPVVEENERVGEDKAVMHQIMLFKYMAIETNNNLNKAGVLLLLIILLQLLQTHLTHFRKEVIIKYK